MSVKECNLKKKRDFTLISWTHLIHFYQDTQCARTCNVTMRRSAKFYVVIQGVP